MAVIVDSLAHDALSLPAEQRVDAVWAAEISRRIARFDAGEMQTIPAANVFADLRRIAPDQ